MTMAYDESLELIGKGYVPVVTPVGGGGVDIMGFRPHRHSFSPRPRYRAMAAVIMCVVSQDEWEKVVGRG